MTKTEALEKVGLLNGKCPCQGCEAYYHTGTSRKCAIEDECQWIEEYDRALMEVGRNG